MASDSLQTSPDLVLVSGTVNMKGFDGPFTHELVCFLKKIVVIGQPI